MIHKLLFGVCLLATFTLVVVAQIDHPEPYVLNPAYGVPLSSVSGPGVITYGYDYSDGALSGFGSGDTSWAKAALWGLDPTENNEFNICGGGNVYTPCVTTAFNRPHYRRDVAYAEDIKDYGFHSGSSRNSFSIDWLDWTCFPPLYSATLCGPGFGDTWQDDTIDVSFGRHPRDILAPSIIASQYGSGNLKARVIVNPVNETWCYPTNIFGTEQNGGEHFGMSVINNLDQCVNFDDASSPLQLFKYGPPMPANLPVAVMPGPVWREGDAPGVVSNFGRYESFEKNFAIVLEDAGNTLPAEPDSVTIDGIPISFPNGLTRVNDGTFTKYYGKMSVLLSKPTGFWYQVNITGAALSPYEWRGHGAHFIEITPVSVDPNYVLPLAAVANQTEGFTYSIYQFSEGKSNQDYYSVEAAMSGLVDSEPNTLACAPSAYEPCPGALGIIPFVAFTTNPADYPFGYDPIGNLHPALVADTNNIGIRFETTARIEVAGLYVFCSAWIREYVTTIRALGVRGAGHPKSVIGPMLGFTDNSITRFTWTLNATQPGSYPMPMIAFNRASNDFRVAWGIVNLAGECKLLNSSGVSHENKTVTMYATVDPAYLPEHPVVGISTADSDPITDGFGGKLVNTSPRKVRVLDAGGDLTAGQLRVVSTQGYGNQTIDDAAPTHHTTSVWGAVADFEYPIHTDTPGPLKYYHTVTKPGAKKRVPVEVEHEWDGFGEGFKCNILDSYVFHPAGVYSCCGWIQETHDGQKDGTIPSAQLRVQTLLPLSQRIVGGPHHNAWMFYGLNDTLWRYHDSVETVDDVTFFTAHVCGIFDAVNIDLVVDFTTQYTISGESKSRFPMVGWDPDVYVRNSSSVGLHHAAYAFDPAQCSQNREGPLFSFTGTGKVVIKGMIVNSFWTTPIGAYFSEDGEMHIDLSDIALGYAGSLEQQHHHRDNQTCFPLSEDGTPVTFGDGRPAEYGICAMPLLVDNIDGCTVSSPDLFASGCTAIELGRPGSDEWGVSSTKIHNVHVSTTNFGISIVMSPTGRTHDITGSTSGFAPHELNRIEENMRIVERNEIHRALGEPEEPLIDVRPGLGVRDRFQGAFHSPVTDSSGRKRCSYGGLGNNEHGLRMTARIKAETEELVPTVRIGGPGEGDRNIFLGGAIFEPCNQQSERCRARVENNYFGSTPDNSTQFGFRQQARPVLAEGISRTLDNIHDFVEFRNIWNDLDWTSSGSVNWVPGAGSTLHQPSNLTELYMIAGDTFYCGDVLPLNSADTILGLQACNIMIGQEVLPSGEVIPNPVRICKNSDNQDDLPRAALSTLRSSSRYEGDQRAWNYLIAEQTSPDYMFIDSQNNYAAELDGLGLNDKGDADHGLGTQPNFPKITLVKPECDCEHRGERRKITASGILQTEPFTRARITLQGGNENAGFKCIRPSDESFQNIYSPERELSGVPSAACIAYDKGGYDDPVVLRMTGNLIFCDVDVYTDADGYAEWTCTAVEEAPGSLKGLHGITGLYGFHLNSTGLKPDGWDVYTLRRSSEPSPAVLVPTCDGFYAPCTDILPGQEIPEDEVLLGLNCDLPLPKDDGFPGLPSLDLLCEWDFSNGNFEPSANTPGCEPCEGFGLAVLNGTFGVVDGISAFTPNNNLLGSSFADGVRCQVPCTLDPSTGRCEEWTVAIDMLSYEDTQSTHRLLYVGERNRPQGSDFGELELRQENVLGIHNLGGISWIHGGWQRLGAAFTSNLTKTYGFGDDDRVLLKFASAPFGLQTQGQVNWNSAAEPGKRFSMDGELLFNYARNQELVHASYGTVCVYDGFASQYALNEGMGGPSDDGCPTSLPATPAVPPKQLVPYNHPVVLTAGNVSPNCIKVLWQLLSEHDSYIHFFIAQPNQTVCAAAADKPEGALELNGFGQDRKDNDCPSDKPYRALKRGETPRYLTTITDSPNSQNHMSGQMNFCPGEEVLQGPLYVFATAEPQAQPDECRVDCPLSDWSAGQQMKGCDEESKCVFDGQFYVDNHPAAWPKDILDFTMCGICAPDWLRGRVPDTMSTATRTVGRDTIMDMLMRWQLSSCICVDPLDRTITNKKQIVESDCEVSMWEYVVAKAECGTTALAEQGLLYAPLCSSSSQWPGATCSVCDEDTEPVPEDSSNSDENEFQRTIATTALRLDARMEELREIFSTDDSSRAPDASTCTPCPTTTTGAPAAIDCPPCVTTAVRECPPPLSPSSSTLVDLKDNIPSVVPEHGGAQGDIEDISKASLSLDIATTVILAIIAAAVILLFFGCILVGCFGVGRPVMKRVNFSAHASVSAPLLAPSQECPPIVSSPLDDDCI